MHLRDSATATVMRRASTGPHALMQRRAIRAYVPDRGSVFSGLSAISTTQSIATGASRGATVGSAVPIIGAPVGAIVGAITGLVDSAFNRVDPENYNFQQAMQMSQANGPESVLNIQNKYLVLAGLFDLTPNQIKGNIPIYKKYGHMGEQRFVTDMINLVYSAAQAGQITPNDNAQTVYNRIVLPWINGFGFGTMADTNAEMITYILMGMLAEYFAGLQTRWFAVGGDYPFGGLPPFSLPQAVAPTSSATPSPVSAPQTAAPQGQSELQSYLAGHLPAVGASVGYTRDGNGQFMAVPAGGTFVDVSSTPPVGAWILQYSTGRYVLVNGTLVPYGNASAQPAQIIPSVPARSVAAPQSGETTLPSSLIQGSTTAQSAPVTTATALAPSAPTIQYVPTGSGAYYPAPVSAPSAVSTGTAGPFGLSNEELMLGVAGAVVLVVLLKKKGRSV